MYDFSFDAIGTVWHIELPDSLSTEERARVEEKVRARIESFDRAYSRFRPDSLVTEMSRTAGTYELPPDALPMLTLYKELYDLTDGAFTPLIGSTLSEAGYDAAYSFAPGAVSAPRSWERTLTFEHPFLTLSAPALLDFGAAGKGYLVDLVSDVLREEGVDVFVVNAGGDIYVSGMEACVALEHPDDPSHAIGVATLSDRSICGSSGHRRSWGAYHHILDPRTLASPRDILAVWTVAPSALLADALATGLYLAPPERFAAYDFEYLILLPDYSVMKSPGFPAELFTA